MAAPPNLPLPDGVMIAVGSTLSESARVLSAPFGDGYGQETGDGINTIEGKYSVSFDGLTRPEAMQIRNFFKDQKGYKKFYFTPPGEIEPRLWVCKTWDRGHTSGAYDRVSATFEERFNP